MKNIIDSSNINIFKLTMYLALLVVIFVIYSKLYKELSVVYVEKDQSIEKVNYIDLYFYKALDGVLSIFSKKEDGLDKVSIFVTDKVINSIYNHDGTKAAEWYRASISNNNKLEKIKIKARGSNPTNWLFDKKSFKVKLSKNNIRDFTRKYNYSIPRNPGLLGTYLGYFIANKANILSPEARLVELRLNNKPAGVYIEIEGLDEGFLRKNNIMPIDLYKGTSSRRHSKPYVDKILTTNVSLWKKSAYFNQYDKKDKTRFKYALDLINSLKHGKGDYKKFKEVFDIDSWARYSAYQTLMQSWHNYESNNLSMLYDHWRGKVIPISSDTIFDDDNNMTIVDKNIIYDNDPTLVERIYNNDPEFLKKKYDYLKSMISDGILDEAINEIDRIKELLINSWSRDPNKSQYYTINSIERNINLKLEISKVRERILFIKENLHELLNSAPKVFFNINGKSISVGVDSLLPISDVYIAFKDRLKNTDKLELFYDVNSNNKIDNSDKKIPVIVDKKKLKIDFIFASNRSTKSKNNSRVDLFSSEPAVNYIATKFNIISNASLPEVDSIFINNNKYATDIHDLSLFVTPTYGALYASENDNVINIKGNVVIKKDVSFEKPVVIHKGSNISLYPGVSLIFKNKVIAIGDVNNKIRINAFSDENWGTFAIIGKKTKGSVLSDIIIENGSGELTNTTQFTSSLSIHDTSDIKIKNCTIKNNKIYDDMVHIIYSSNIEIESCIFDNSLSDSIDIDLSEVKISKIRVQNSGNDAIDLMGSNVYIKDSLLEGAKDKGVSVGEGSKVLIYNSDVKRNLIGVQAKDSSIAYIIGSNFDNNQTQFSAYSKNWRYGGGGEIKVSSSNVVSTNNLSKQSIEKGSKLTINNSYIGPVAVDNSKRVKIRSQESSMINKIGSLSSEEIQLINYWDNGIMSGGYSYVR